jgi:hypothetical protein
MRFSARAFALTLSVYICACSLVRVEAVEEAKDKVLDKEVCENAEADADGSYSCNAVKDTVKDTDTVSSGETASRTLTTAPESEVPLKCQAVMATSTISDAGWGVFTLVDMQGGKPFLPGDVVIQVTDLDLVKAHTDGMKLMLDDYLVDSGDTRGFYEGKRVVSAIPGIGMLANGLQDNQNNVRKVTAKANLKLKTKTDAKTLQYSRQSVQCFSLL